MASKDDLARVARDRAIRRLAVRHAGSYALAEDALQQTYLNVARTQNLEGIRDLAAFFRTALVHEISHQLARPVAAPVEDIDATTDPGPERGSWPGSTPPPSVETQTAWLLLGERLLERLDDQRDQLTACVPARSSDPQRYRAAVFAAARRLLLLLLQGNVAMADWNAVLRAVYPAWYEEPGLERDAFDQRLSRARRDVRDLLQMIAPRAELAS